MPQVTRQSATPKKSSNSGSVWDRIVPISQATHEEGIKMAIYGRSGTGKTTIISSFKKPMLMLICSNSAAGETRSIKNVPGIETVTLTDDQELPEMVNWLRSNEKFASVSLDHASAYSDLLLRRLSKGGVPTSDHWQELSALMRERLSQLLGLKCNVVISAQEREFNAGDQKHDMLVPNVSFGLSPAVAGWLAPAVDYSIYTFIKTGMVKTGNTAEILGKKVEIEEEAPVWCARLSPHPVFVTKFRVPKGTRMPDYIQDPTYDKFMALINGKPMPK